MEEIHIRHAPEYSFNLERLARDVARWHKDKIPLSFSDSLGREEIARAIAKEIRSDKTARVIGVYGSWGSGKSYLLGQTIKCLLNENQNGKQNVIVCIFEAWRYEMEGDLGIGLIKALVHSANQIIPHKLTDPPLKYEIIAKSLLDLIVEIGPAVVPGGETLAKLIGQVAKTGIEVISNTQSSPVSLVPKSAVDEIRNKMNELVNEILTAAYQDSTKDHRVVIFIDDLDRCSPENMVRMFEWLKVHLLADNCVYVMALDHVAAARAIVGRYKEYLGKEHDLAYGFRYLEKLVDSEYELGQAIGTEKMALSAIYPDKHYERLSQAARELSGTDFPGVGNMDKLLSLRCLATPRTMLKIVYRFERTMNAILAEEAAPFRSSLPSGYPFWIAFLISMYYQLEPDVVAEFIRGRGSIAQLMNNPKSIDSEKWGTGPMREFCKFASDLGEFAGTSLQLPKSETLARLASIIQQNTFTSEE